MSQRPAPAVPDSLPLREALRRSEPLASLRARLQGSQDRFAAVTEAVPPTLRRFLRPGPLDEEGWTLLAANAGVAAKLRQLRPRLEASLADAGYRDAKLVIKVHAPGA